MPRSGTLSNNNCDIRMDGEGMDAQIKPGNEVKGTEQQRPQSSGGVYFYVPNALQDETHLTFSPAYWDAEARMVYATSPVTLSYLPSAAGRLKQNRPHQHPNPTAKPIWEKLTNPPPFPSHPPVSKLYKPLLLSWTVREGTPLLPDSSCPVFASLNPLHWLLLRSCSSQPHPAFCSHLLSYTFPQTLGSATGPQHKWTPDAYNLWGICWKLQRF